MPRQPALSVTSSAVSPSAAHDHYLSTTEEHFRRAATAAEKGAAESGAQGPEIALQQPSADSRTDPKNPGDSLVFCEVVRESTNYHKSVPDRGMTPTGFEPVSRA
jgi:hypothetical protein